MHPLDNAVWTALTTLQSEFANTAGIAKRFPPETTLLGAIERQSPEAFAALEQLTQEAPVILYSPSPLKLPEGWTVTRHVELFQMVQEENPASALPVEPVELTEADVPEMSVLYAATRPARTLCPKIQRLGMFLGVRHEGKLVAMGGMRLHLPGYREITTVGTLPGYTGRGYATALAHALSARIRNAGERAFLTVRTDNERAVGIYQRLGFRTRTTVHSTTIRKDR
jgi:ribosomal protein S18 acetylase RimI-like enzyme